MRYEVKDIVSDYGVYRDDELLVICNNKHNAALICSILAKDKNHDVFKSSDFEKFVSDTSDKDFLFLGEYREEC